MAKQHVNIDSGSSERLVAAAENRCVHVRVAGTKMIEAGVEVSYIPSTLLPHSSPTPCTMWRQHPLAYQLCVKVRTQTAHFRSLPARKNSMPSPRRGGGGGRAAAAAAAEEQQEKEKNYSNTRVVDNDDT